MDTVGWLTKGSLHLIHSFIQDEKPEEKKESDGDVEMKVDDEPLSPGKDAGDISPINGSISNLAEDGKPSTKPTKKAEPAFEMRPNLSRVTPAQLAYITFPPEGRFQPVRAVSAKPAPLRAGKAGVAGGKASSAPVGLVSEKYAGGGCILILSDMQSEEEAEFINFEPAPAAAPEPVPSGNAPSVLPTGPHIALDETSPEVGPPDVFEVRGPSSFPLHY
jgi:26S proteasome regulatory subunit N2